MKKRFYVFTLVLIFWAVISTSAFAQGPAAADANTQPIKDEKTAVSEGTKILDNILKGLGEKDYAVFTKDFDQKMKETIGPDQFKALLDQVEKEYGSVQSKTLLGVLQRKNYTTILWKGKFSSFEGDVMITLTLIQQNGGIKVAGLYFH